MCFLQLFSASSSSSPPSVLSSHTPFHDRVNDRIEDQNSLSILYYQNTKYIRSWNLILFFKTFKIISSKLLFSANIYPSSKFIHVSPLLSTPCQVPRLSLSLHSTNHSIDFITRSIIKFQIRTIRSYCVFEIYEIHTGLLNE